MITALLKDKNGWRVNPQASGKDLEKRRTEGTPKTTEAK
jgi:hypothetical protein